MKISNEFVKIRQDDKEMTLKNLILNSYLKLFSKTQYESIEDGLISDNRKKSLDICFVKLDTTLDNINPDSVFDIDDFDFYINAVNKNLDYSSQGSSITYTYGIRESDGIYDIKNGVYVDDLSDFIGKKITALGFGNVNDNIFAVIDTSNYSITIEDRRSLNIMRKDNFTSNAICDNNPYHLNPMGRGRMLYNNGLRAAIVYAKLYSVGLGRTLGELEQEFVVGEDVEVNIIDDYSFSFNFKKGDVENLHPGNNEHPNSSKFPIAEFVARYQFPRSTFYAHSSKYPMRTDYRYVIYKYRLYYTTQGDSMVELDEYYTMNYITDNRGLITVNLKIERNGENG